MDLCKREVQHTDSYDVCAVLHSISIWYMYNDVILHVVLSLLNVDKRVPVIYPRWSVSCVSDSDLLSYMCICSHLHFV